MSSLSLSFNGSLMGVGTGCGYGYAAVELINAWNRQGVPVWWGKEECPIAFSFSQPEFYNWQSDSQYKIGYTPWESTQIPSGWPNLMNNMDEIWTTSYACREWFEKNGITAKIRVLAHGINADHFSPKMRKISEGEVFKFLHIGEPAERKGGEYAYNAFVESFGDNENVSLTLKGRPRFKIEAKNVHVVRGMLPQEQLLKLYHDHHAFIYPTNGEGFGLLPFQAAATGMPTLVTDWSGPQDYMDFCWPIRTEGLIKAHYEPHEGMWAAPSIDSLKLWMEYFVDSPSYFFHKADIKARKLHKDWGWDSIAKLSIKWFNEALEIKKLSM